jgi:hypothetical protein
MTKILIVLTATCLLSTAALAAPCLHQAPGRSPSYGEAAKKAGFKHEPHENCQPMEKKS